RILHQEAVEAPMKKATENIESWIKSPSPATIPSQLQDVYDDGAGNSCVAENPQWVANLQGDHAHELERWFRGSGRARLSLHRYYRSYKGAKDPSPLNEEQLIQQGDQMNSANSHLVRQGVRLT